MGRGNILIPGWLLATVGFSLAIFLAGWEINDKAHSVLDELSAIRSEMGWMSYRMCRIERDRQLDVWPGCERFQFTSPPQKVP